MKKIIGVLALACLSAPAVHAVSCGTVAAPTSCSITVGGTTMYTFSNFRSFSNSATGGALLFAAADIDIDVSSPSGLLAELTFSKNNATPNVAFGVNAGGTTNFSYAYDATLSAAAPGTVAFQSPFAVGVAGSPSGDGFGEAQFVIPGAPTCAAFVPTSQSSCTVPAQPLTIAAGDIVTLVGNTGNASILSYTNRFNAAFTAAIPPTLSQAFSPAAIAVGGVSTLNVTLDNLDPADSTLTSPLVATLPSGLVVAAVPNAGTTCLGSGTPAALPGGATVTLPAGRIIPSGSCFLFVDVTAPGAGSFTATLPAGALVTTTGTNAAAASAVLSVAGILSVPTLSAWALALLAALLGLAGFAVLRRRTI